MIKALQKGTWYAHSSTHLSLHLGRSATQDFEKAINLVGISPEARQQELEVDEFGDPVRAKVITSLIGQQGDHLGCWTHLMKREGKNFEEFFLFEFLKLMVSLLTFPDRISRPSTRLLEFSCSSWILLEMVFWEG